MTCRAEPECVAANGAPDVPLQAGMATSVDADVAVHDFTLDDLKLYRGVLDQLRLNATRAAANATRAVAAREVAARVRFRGQLPDPWATKTRRVVSRGVDARWNATAAGGVSDGMASSPLFGRALGPVWSEACDIGEVAVGIELYSNSAGVYAAGPLRCAPSADVAAAAEGSGAGSTGLLRGERHGGNAAGRHFDGQCPSGTALTGLLVWTDRFGRLTAFAPACRPLAATRGLTAELQLTCSQATNLPDGAWGDLDCAGELVGIVYGDSNSLRRGEKLNEGFMCPAGSFVAAVSGHASAKALHGVQIKCVDVAAQH